MATFYGKKHDLEMFKNSGVMFPTYTNLQRNVRTEVKDVPDNRVFNSDQLLVTWYCETECKQSDLFNFSEMLLWRCNMIDFYRV